MDAITARKIIDACHEAGQVESLLPALPKGMTPLYVRVLDAVYSIDQREGRVCVSDISRSMGLSFPGVTRAVKALEALGAVQKASDPKDRRFVTIELTELGQEWYRAYVGDFYENLANDLVDIGEDDVKTMIRVIERVREVMRLAGETETYHMKDGEKTDGLE